MKLKSHYRNFAAGCLRQTTFLLATWVLATTIAVNLDAQEKGFEPQYSEPETVYFEFGLKITSKGSSTGITGTVPIPVDWPEQEITVVEERKTDNVRKLTYKESSNRIKQLVIKVNQMGAGEVAQGSVVLKVNKRNIILPASPEELKLAQRIPGKVRQFLKPSPYIESKHAKIKQLAKTVAIDKTETAWQQVESVYKWVRENVEYKFDKQIHTCLDALDSGHGDCEELSSIFIAICRAKGIPARAVWIPSHTYPEFYLVDGAGNGHWFPCQAAGTYQFGEMEEVKPILQKGDRFKLPGSKKYLRYVQPTLVAKDATAGLAIEFIARQVGESEFDSKSKQADKR